MRDLVRTREGALHHLDAAYRFRWQVATALREGQPPPDPIDDRYAIYGVWVGEDSRPVYIGHTRDYRRRLWDLPIGDSHHLVNSFPTEIWTRIVVVRWWDLLEQNDVPVYRKARDVRPLVEKRQRVLRRASGRRAGARLYPDLVMGLTFEYLLQLELQPLFNVRQRSRQRPEYIERDLTADSRIGAVAQKVMRELFTEVYDCWLAASEAEREEALLDKWRPHVRIVFPQDILARMRS